MNKKGVELSMNVIIIAAIGLLVLVILAVLVINAGGKTQGGLNSCTAKGGICKSPSDCTASSGKNLGLLDCGSGNTCCSPFVATG